METINWVVLYAWVGVYVSFLTIDLGLIPIRENVYEKMFAFRIWFISLLLLVTVATTLLTLK